MDKATLSRRAFLLAPLTLLSPQPLISDRDKLRRARGLVKHWWACVHRNWRGASEHLKHHMMGKLCAALALREALGMPPLQSPHPDIGIYRPGGGA